MRSLSQPRPTALLSGPASQPCHLAFCCPSLPPAQLPLAYHACCRCRCIFHPIESLKYRLAAARFARSRPCCHVRLVSLLLGVCRTLKVKFSSKYSSLEHSVQTNWVWHSCCLDYSMITQDT